MKETDQLLFEVIVDIPKVQENTKIALAALTRLREEKQKTQQQFKDNLIGEETYSKVMNKLASEIDKTEKELAGYIQVVEKQGKAQKTATDTSVKLAAGLINLSTQQTKLTTSTQQAGKGLLAEAKALTDVTKAGDGFGQFVDSLNDKLTYQKTVSQATALSMDQLDEVVGNLDKGYQGLTKAQRDDATVGGVLLKLTGDLSRVQKDNQRTLDASRKTVGDYIKEIRIAGVSVSDMITSFKNGGAGFKTFASSIFTVRGAFVALTAIPIVALLSGLYILLTKTQAGMDFVARATGAVSAVFNVLIKNGAELTKAFIQLFTSPREAIQSFYRVLRGLPAEMSNAATAGAAVVDMNNKIADSERNILVERSKNRAEIERLKKISEDTTKSIEERKAAAKAAYDLENKTLQGLIGVQAQRVEAAKQELALSQKTREDQQKVADEEIKLNELREESFGKQTELQNKLNELMQEGIRQRVTLELAATNNQIANLQQVGGESEKVYTEMLRLKKQQIEQQFELDTIGLTKESQLYKAYEIKKQAELTQLEYDAVIERSNQIDRIEQDGFEKRLSEARKNSIEYLKIQKDQIEAQATQETIAATRTLKIKEEVDAKLEQIDAKRVAAVKEINKQIKQIEQQNANELLQARLARTKEGSKAEYEVQIEMIRKRLAEAVEDEDLTYEQFVNIQANAFRQMDDLEKRRRAQVIDRIKEELTQVTGAVSNLFEAQANIQNQRLDQQQEAALKSAGLSAEARERIQQKFDQKREEAERKQAEKRRKIAEVETLINTAANVAKVFPDPLLMALAGAVGLAQIALIESQKFEYGGEIVDGPSHAGGGVKYRVGRSHRIVELEGDEGVINKRSMRMPGVRQMASELNQLGGGVAFPGTRRISAGRMLPAYTPARMEYGGIVNHVYAGQSQPPATIDYNQLGQVVSGMVTEAVKALPPQYVRVGDIRSGVGKQVQVETNNTF